MAAISVAVEKKSAAKLRIAADPSISQSSEVSLTAKAVSLFQKQKDGSVSRLRHFIPPVDMKKIAHVLTGGMEIAKINTRLVAVTPSECKLIAHKITPVLMQKIADPIAQAEKWEKAFEVVPGKMPTIVAWDCVPFGARVLAFWALNAQKRNFSYAEFGQEAFLKSIAHAKNPSNFYEVARGKWRLTEAGKKSLERFIGYQFEKDPNCTDWLRLSIDGSEADFASFVDGTRGVSGALKLPPPSAGLDRGDLKVATQSTSLDACLEMARLGYGRKRGGPSAVQMALSEIRRLPVDKQGAPLAQIIGFLSREKQVIHYTDLEDAFSQCIPLLRAKDANFPKLQPHELPLNFLNGSLLERHRAEMSASWGAAYHKGHDFLIELGVKQPHLVKPILEAQSSFVNRWELSPKIIIEIAAKIAEFGNPTVFGTVVKIVDQKGTNGLKFDSRIGAAVAAECALFPQFDRTGFAKRSHNFSRLTDALGNLKKELERTAGYSSRESRNDALNLPTLTNFITRISKRSGEL